ncbi:MAG: hypothetical protein HYY65_02215 [Candidatus Tectomicrobia bacterium]|uniref:Uncharacterized protein n=1 Tax=Tectimicrobiota bacterium TaxID=2528274 RepID=A0A932GMQ3_UNCTE|nr:hypothetical protein [Candidatus Tectomicrobia bacterium]
MKFSLAEQFPELAAELARLLDAQGEIALAQRVSSLNVVDRCRCGDDFCATMYALPHPKGPWGKGHRTIALHPEEGFLIVDVLHDDIAEIEVLFRDSVRDRLVQLMP